MNQRVIPRLGLLLLAAALLGMPTFAQYEDDDQTEDHAERDRRYLERYQPKEAPAAQAPPADADAERALAEREFLAYVDGLIRDKDYRAASSDGYRVQTDDPRVDAAAVVQLMDSFRGYFEQFWRGRLEPRPFEDQSRVFLFYSFFKYNKLLDADFSRVYNRPKGHYGSFFKVITIHSDADTPAEFGDTLIHEATHQLMDQQFDWPNGQPVWVAEGFASYFGYTAFDGKDGWKTGEIGGKQVELFRDGVKARKPQQPQFRLQSFRDAMKQASGGDSLYGKLLTVRDPDRFYGQNAGVNYAASWLLVHYLLHGEGGRYAGAFAGYLAAEQRGEAGPTSLLEELGTTPEALDRAVLAHARTLKVR